MITSLLSNFDHSPLTEACFLMVLYNAAKPSIYRVPCSSKALHVVLCERTAQNITAAKFEDRSGLNFPAFSTDMFLCSHGECISILKVCDGINDCPEIPNDEIGCNCKAGQLIVTDSHFCATNCHLSNCTCSELFRQKIIGGCEKYWEIKYFHHPALDYDVQTNPLFFNCSDSFKIPSVFVNDLVPDCKNSEDEPVLMQGNYSNLSLDNNCKDENMLECFPGHTRCYYKEHKCLYYLSNRTNALLICRNGKHLENCEVAACVNQFKCPKSYCIPYMYVCDGKWDCWNGHDEHQCESRSCKNLFLCSKTSVCIPLDSVCNDISDCPYNDDEYFCINCLKGCGCLGLAISCKNKTFLLVSSIDLNAYLYINIQESTLMPFSGLSKTILLTLSHNNISNFYFVFPTGSYQQLRILSLEFNRISVIKKHTNKVEFSNLLVLNLSQNIISKIENSGFASFRSLYTLDLSSNEIHHLISDELDGLYQLKVLNLFGNILIKTTLNMFSILNLNLVHTESLQVCCIANKYGVLCTSKPIFFHSCHRLLNNLWVRLCVWIFGCSILCSNILSLYFFNLHKSDRNPSNTKIKSVNSIILRTINILDLLFGLYLILIEIIDSIYGIHFIEYDLSWRQSLFCKILAGATLFLIITSCGMIFLISFSRYTGIMYPLNNPLNLKRTKLIIFTLVFIVIFTSFVVLLVNFHLTPKYHLSNSLCIVLGDAEGSYSLKLMTWFTSCILFLCLLATSILYFMIVKQVKKAADSMKTFTILGQSQSWLSTRKHSITICLCLSLCYIPGSVTFFCSTLSNKYSLVLIYITTLIILPINSILNPYIYSLSGTLKKLNKLCFQKKISSGISLETQNT